MMMTRFRGYRMKSLMFIVISAAVMICGVDPAHAQYPVYDAAVFGQTQAISGSTSAISSTDTSILNTEQDIDKHVTSIDTTINQQQSSVSTLFNPDDGQPMQPDGLPMQAAQTQQNLSYTAAASTSDGQTFYNQNDLSTNQSGLTTGLLSSGGDEASKALKNMLITASNIQGMAYDNLKALESRLNELDDMNKQLATAPNITAIEAIKGRIAVETLMVQAQEAQAVNLNAMASAQQEIDQHNREQAIRIDHQQMASNLVSLGSGFGLNLN